MSPDELDKNLEQLYNAAQSASSEGLRDEALKKVEEALQLLEAYGEDTEKHSYPEFVMLKADINWSAGEYDDAYKGYHRVALMEPERVDARIAMGVAQYHLCRFAAAKAVLEMCSLEEGDDAETWYYLGLIALREGKRDLAARHFEVAHELAEERFPVPADVPEAEIVDMVEAIVASLPEPIRDALANVPIILEPHPDEALLFSSDPPMDPLLLGLFDGVPLPDRGAFEPVTSPTRILIFSENIRLIAADRDMLEEELWVTVKHEIGHYFGLSEDDLAERGLD